MFVTFCELVMRNRGPPVTFRRATPEPPGMSLLADMHFYASIFIAYFCLLH